MKTSSLLKRHWSTTHGVFDLSLVTEERLQRYLAPYTSEDGKPCLDFRGMKEESTVCRLVAVKRPFPEQSMHVSIKWTALTGAPNEKKIGIKAYSSVLCFLISFYCLLKGHLCELTLFDLFGCGS